jgi:hypothetical protein
MAPDDNTAYASECARLAELTDNQPSEMILLTSPSAATATYDLRRLTKV